MSFIRLIVCRRILGFILLLSAGVQPLGSDTVPITAPTVATSESAITGTLTTVTAASSSSSSSSIVILHEYSTNGKCEGLPFRQIALTLGDCYEHHMEPDPYSIVKGTLFYAHRVSWLSPNNGLFYEQWGTGEGCDGPPKRFITTQSSSCFTIDRWTQFNLTFLSSYTNSLISTVSGSASESESESESDLIPHMNLHPDQVTVTYFHTSECNESSVLLGPDLMGAPRLGDCFNSLQHHCTPQGDEVIISAYLDDECSSSMLIRQTRWRTNTCIPTWMVRQGVGWAQPTWMRWSCPDRYLPSVQNRSNAEASMSISISDPNPDPVRPRVVPAPVTVTVPVLSNPPQLNRTIQFSCSDYGCTRNCQPYRGSFSANWSCSPSGLTTGWVTQRLRHANETSSDIMAGLLEPASEAACFFGSFYQCPQPVPISLQLNASALGGMIVEVEYRGDHCGVGHDYPSESELDSASDRGGYWRASLYAPYECYSQTNSVYAVHFRTGVVVVMKYAKPVVEGEPHCQRLLSIHYFPPNMCIQLGGMSYRWTRMESPRGPTWAHPFRMDERNRLMTPLACSNTSTPRPRPPDRIALADLKRRRHLRRTCPSLKYDWVALWSYVPPIIEGPDEPNHHCAKPFKV